MKTKIYFICTDNSKPAGGVKQLYRQVDLLNANGYNATILHKRKGFRCNWFKNETIVESNKLIFNQLKLLDKTKISFFGKLILNIKIRFGKKIDKNSILVFPEIFGPNIDLIEKGNRKVIFNQNCYYTFDNYTMNNDLIESPYSKVNNLATIVVSSDSEKYLRFVFDNINLFRIRLGIDESMFSFSDQKSKQITFMPRKLNEDVVQVINILKQRKKCIGWEFVAIENKNEHQVSEIMKKSMIFLSFNYREGFGLPPVEAMACGNIVVGYHGQGGKEFFDDKFNYLVQDRNVIDFVEKVERAVSEYENNPTHFLIKGKNASEFVLKTYNIENEKNDILGIWSSLNL